MPASPAVPASSATQLQEQSAPGPQKSARAKGQDGQPDRRYKRLDITMKRHGYRADALIEVLHVAQEAFGYLEEDVLHYVARRLKLPLSRVYGVATFYHLFTLKPSGAHSCVVCLGTACYVKGGGKIQAALEGELSIAMGETTPDGEISLMAARCLGACGIAPAVVYDGAVAGKQSGEQAIARIHNWQNGAE